jgi:hypothetical protein
MKFLIIKWLSRFEWWNKYGYRAWRDFRMPEWAKTARQQMRELTARADRNIAKAQSECPHLQGILGQGWGNLTSIVWHRLDRGGETFGVCTNCLRKFWPSDLDYKHWRGLPSGNKMSTGGQVVPIDFDLPYGGYASTPKTEGLDALSDGEIEDLFQRTREYIKNGGVSAAETELAVVVKDLAKKPRKKTPRRKASV